MKQLVEGADAIGAVLVNRHQGFLPNKRQLRMGGLAALEMAQTLRQLVGPLGCCTLPCLLSLRLPAYIVQLGGIMT